MTFQDLGKYLWREIHRGNLLIIALCLFCFIWIVLPTYKWVKDKLVSHDIATEYVITNQDVLEARIKALEDKTKAQLSERKGGKIGTTYH